MYLTITLFSKQKEIFLFKETARRVARVSIESKIDMDEERYVDGFKPYMMDVVKAWVDGQSFASICKMTSIYEGKYSIEKKE